MSHVYTTNNTNVPLTLQPNGASNLSVDRNGTITLTDGLESATLTVHMVKGLQEVKGFLDYAEQCNSEVGELWRAYKTANKLEK